MALRNGSDLSRRPAASRPTISVHRSFVQSGCPPCLPKSASPIGGREGGLPRRLAAAKPTRRAPKRLGQSRTATFASSAGFVGRAEPDQPHFVFVPKMTLKPPTNSAEEPPSPVSRLPSPVFGLEKNPFFPAEATRSCFTSSGASQPASRVRGEEMSSLAGGPPSSPLFSVDAHFGASYYASENLGVQGRRPISAKIRVLTKCENQVYSPVWLDRISSQFGTGGHAREGSGKHRC